MAANRVLAKMAVQISANNAEFARALSKSQKDLSSFTGSVKGLAASLGVAFSVQQVASFAIEVSKLSGEAEAVRAAFERLPESTRLMSELKQATGGTVSELDLMKRSVQAANFGISLQALPKLLEFATLRAQQTGQSVDYLVDSIVTGIGRKSKLILDNLGISAVQLDEALGGASTAASSIGEVADAVGRIAEANLKNMEGFAENASTKIQRLSASWENLKVAIGDSANSSGFLGKSLNVFTGLFDALAGDQLTTGFNQLTASGGRASEILERFAAAGGKIDLSWQDLLERGFVRTEAAARKYEKILADIAKKQKDLAVTKVEIDPVTGLPTSGGKRWPSLAEKHIISLNSLKEKEKQLLELFGETDVADKKKLQNTSAQILAIREQIKAIDDLLIKQKEAVAFQLSQTAQRALAGTPVTETTDITGVSTTVPVDTKAMFAKMEEYRNANKEVTEEVSGLWVDLSGVVGGAITSMAEGLGAAIVGVQDFGDTIIKAFIGFAKEFGSMLISTGIAALALESVLANPFAAIAAGAALVALAGAASASLSKVSGGSGAHGSSRSGASGHRPSEVRHTVEGQISGYTIALSQTKEGYRRSRLG